MEEARIMVKRASLRVARDATDRSRITSAEWLDVNYGSLVRELLLDGLGGTDVALQQPLERLDGLTAQSFTPAASV